jgi:hypothetical protein
MSVSEGKRPTGVYAEHYTLAVDIERSGAKDIHDTMAIGAAVRNLRCEEVGRYTGKAYVPGECTFEARCKEEFWDKHPKALKAVTFDHTLPLSKKDREYIMIFGFHKFRIEWETRAASEGAKLDLVSDNASYDFAFINKLYFEYLPDAMPIPYTASTQKYRRPWDTHCMQRGFLMAVDPEFLQTHGWGFTKRIEELYDVPDDGVRHDHDPANDASTIAREHAVMLGIMCGTIKRREKEH